MVSGMYVADVYSRKRYCMQAIAYDNVYINYTNMKIDG